MDQSTLYHYDDNCHYAVQRKYPGGKWFFTFAGDSVLVTRSLGVGVYNAIKVDKGEELRLVKVSRYLPNNDSDPIVTDIIYAKRG